MNDLDLLRDADPSAEPSPALLARARAALVEGTTGRTPYDGLPVPARRRHRRRWTVAVASVAAAAAALLVVPVLDSGPAQPTATASAAQVFLLRSAEAAAAADAPDARDARYWYVRSSVGGAQAFFAGTREVWIGHRDRGLLRENGQRTDNPPTKLDRASFFGLTWEQLFDLPTETSALRAKVYALAGDAGPGPDAEAFVVVGDLLRESPAPPSVRAALLRVAATIPGVTLGARTTDSEGREVVPVSRRQPGYEDRLLMDPNDGRLLGEENVTTTDEQPQGQPPLPAGTVAFRTTTLASGPAGEHRRPPLAHQGTAGPASRWSGRRRVRQSRRRTLGW